MTHTPAATAPTADTESVFCPDDLVLPDHPDTTSRFGDDIWDLRPIRRTPTDGTTSIDFTTVPERSRRTVKEVLMVCIRPDHPAARQLRWTPPKRTSHSIENTFFSMRALARFADKRNKSVSELTARDTARLLDEWSSHAPATVAVKIMQLRRFRTVSPALSDGGLRFEPWPGRSARSLTAQPTDTPTANKTAPIPWPLWSSLIEGAFLIVDRYGPDIITAEQARQANAGAPNTGRVKDAEALFEAFVAGGGKIPLHTGCQPRSKQPRGHINIMLLGRLTGIHPNCFCEGNRTCRPGLLAQAKRKARTPGQAEHGGLSRPAATTPDGHLWVAELGGGEIEYLASVLRAACYVIIAALTAMRDSEIQHLERGSRTTKDGHPALRSTQYKGRATVGEKRTWWAPAPVLRAVEILELLSTHDRWLFGRTDADFSTYVPSRDIKRLCGYLSAAPSRRPGRGAELGHHRRKLVTHFTKPGEGPPIVEIDQRSLRQSFAVYAARYPEAEVGVGIQLGKAGLRQATPYMNDPSQTAVQLLDDERGDELEARARTLFSGPTAGPAGRELQLLATTLTPDRYDTFIAHVAGRLTPGIVNDCVYNPVDAKCGPGGPKLHNHNCATTGCRNCLIGTTHKPIWTDQLARLDAAIPNITEPELARQMITQRAQAAEVIAALTEDNP